MKIRITKIYIKNSHIIGKRIKILTSPPKKRKKKQKSVLTNTLFINIHAFNHREKKIEENAKNVCILSLLLLIKSMMQERLK